MARTQKRQPRQNARGERRTTIDKEMAPDRRNRIKELSKRVLHKYVIPMTRMIEHRLQRLEQSL